MLIEAFQGRSDKDACSTAGLRRRGSLPVLMGGEEAGSGRCCAAPRVTCMDADSGEPRRPLLPPM